MRLACAQEHDGASRQRGPNILHEEWHSKLKRYLDEAKGISAQDLWTDVESIRSWHPEQAKYPTQKPEALLERISKASSNEGDLVLDCVVGSGTTAAVAEKLNRRWIAADLSRFAIHTTRKRHLSIPDVRPFVVQNLGKYERQAWQAAEFGQDSRAAAGAQAVQPDVAGQLLGAVEVEDEAVVGLRAGRFVHVGSQS
jgi:adenine-specific DNA-methyltransferase